MNKKGSALYDGIVIVGSIALFAFLMVIVGIVASEFNTAWQANPEITPRAQAVVSQGETTLPGAYDWIMAVILFGLPLVSFGLAWINNIPPVFFWLSIGILLLVLSLGFVFGDLWEDANENTLFSGQSSRMPVTNFVFGQFYVYALFVAFVIIAGTWVRLGGSGY